MKIYLLLSIVPIIVSLFYNATNIDGEEKKRSYCIICGIILIFVVGMRNKSVGADMEHYYDIMKSAIDSPSWINYYDKDGQEIGFQFFVFLLSRIFKNPQWLSFIATAISVTSMMVFCYRYSDNIRLSIAMYICLGLMGFHMTAIRQSIAMSICLFAYVFAERKQLLPFVALIILATLMHKTAIVFSLVYLISYLELKPIPLFLVVIGIVLAVYYSPYLIGLANNIWNKEYSNKVLSGGYVAVSIYVLIFIFCIIVTKHPFEKNIDSMMFYILIIGFVIYIERYIGVLIAERISFYFSFSQLILLPNALKNGKIREKDKIAVEMVIYALCILLFMYRLSDSDIMPFKFFWNA